MREGRREGGGREGGRVGERGGESGRERGREGGREGGRQRVRERKLFTCTCTCVPSRVVSSNKRREKTSNSSDVSTGKIDRSAQHHTNTQNPIHIILVHVLYIHCTCTMYIYTHTCTCTIRMGSFRNIGYGLTCTAEHEKMLSLKSMNTLWARTMYS